MTNLQRYKQWLLENESIIRKVVTRNQSNAKTILVNQWDLVCIVENEEGWFKQWVRTFGWDRLGCLTFGAALDICLDNLRVDIEKERSEGDPELGDEFFGYSILWDELADFMAFEPGSH